MKFSDESFMSLMDILNADAHTIVHGRSTLTHSTSVPLMLDKDEDASIWPKGSAKQDVSGGMHVASGTCRISTAAPMDPTHNPHEASDVKSSPYKNVSQQPLSSSDQLSTETGNAQVPSSSASHGMQPMHPPPQAGCEAGLAPGIQGEGADDLPLAPLTSPTAFGADAARIFDAVLGGLGDEEGHDFMHLGSGEYPMSITPQSIALPTASPGTAMCHHDMQEASPGPQPVPPFPPFMDTPFAQANAMAAVPGALDMGQPHPPYHTTHTLPASGSNGAPLPPLPQTHSGHAWYPGSNPGDIAAPRTSSPSRQPQPPPSTSAFHISMPGSPSHAPAHPLQQPRRHPGPGPGPTTSTYPYPYAYSQPNLAPAPAPHRLSRSQLPSDTDPPHPPAPQHRAPPAPSHSDCSMGPGPSRTSTAGATAFKQLRISCSGNMGPARSSGMDDGRAHGHMQWSSSPQAGPRPGGRAPHVAYEEQGHSPAVVVDSPTKCLQHMHMGGADHPSPGRVVPHNPRAGPPQPSHPFPGSMPMPVPTHAPAYASSQAHLSSSYPSISHPHPTLSRHSTGCPQPLHHSHSQDPAMQGRPQQAPAMSAGGPAPLSRSMHYASASMGGPMQRQHPQPPPLAQTMSAPLAMHPASSAHTAPSRRSGQQQREPDPDKPDEGWMASMILYKKFSADFGAVQLPRSLIRDLAQDLQRIHASLVARRRARELDAHDSAHPAASSHASAPLPSPQNPTSSHLPPATHPAPPPPHHHHPRRPTGHEEGAATSEMGVTREGSKGVQGGGGGTPAMYPSQHTASHAPWPAHSHPQPPAPAAPSPPYWGGDNGPPSPMAARSGSSIGIGMCSQGSLKRARQGSL